MRMKEEPFATSHVIRYVIIFLCNYSILDRRAAGVLLSISGRGLSAVAIASLRAEDDTYAA